MHDGLFLKKQTTIVSADRGTVASIAGRFCNAQQVPRPPTT
jgi:hypothetical protein